MTGAFWGGGEGEQKVKGIGMGPLTQIVPFWPEGQQPRLYQIRLVRHQRVTN
ncbi:MAG: hypothetical protein KatS3mg074_434 [Meiothermus sp.]|uniref:Uncharacterized protein n=1 Tax=Meiothermus hypogaeus TaxID=884155 RepID=A0ABX9MH13_9DEIN|nr:hypothetical protein Mhypo_03474 [Meiothermus hypogaeus]GIW38036.1 MAG: hypothetical protein KatS3mg074_434 [Meiothermus sp.]